MAKINLSQAEFDAWVPLLSLARYFETEFATVPAEVPYLTIDPARTAAWRRRYEAAGREGVPKVGLVFAANPESASAADRSLQAADVARLLRTTEVDWVNLQGGAAGRGLAAAHPGIIDPLNPEAPLARRRPQPLALRSPAEGHAPPPLATLPPIFVQVHALKPREFCADDHER